jgi:hypothetical protein
LMNDQQRYRIETGNHDCSYTNFLSGNLPAPIPGDKNPGTCRPVQF